MTGVLLAVVVLTAILWPLATFPVFLCCLVVAAAAGALRQAQRGTPTTISRMPTSFERGRGRRWRLGIGLAFGFHGAFPFVYVTRRLR